jgi:hypothetical protein
MMKRDFRILMGRLLLAASLGLTLTLAQAAMTCGQEIPPVPDTPPASDAAEKATDTAEKATDTAKGATDTAKGATDTAKGAADAAKGPSSGARDAAKGAADRATDSARDTTDPFDRPAPDAAKTGQDTARDATRSARDAARGAGDTARDATRDARDSARGVGEDARDAARDAGDTARGAARDARDTARDTFRGQRDSALDRTRDARESVRDAARDTRETFREGQDDALDAARDARESFRDERDSIRDSARDTREDFRDDRDAIGDRRRDVREDFREDRGEARDTARDSGERFRDERSDVGEAREDLRDLTRDAREDFRDDRRDLTRDAREDFRRDTSRESFRSSSRVDSRFSVENIRPADVGLWFGRSTGDGLIISDVATTGPMASLISRIGFREGDQIVAVDGNRVTRQDDFTRYLFADEVLHERVPVVVMRDDRRQTLYVEPIRLIEQVQVVQHDPLEQFGIILDDRYDDRIVVWRVIQRSPAFYAGIQPGDVITTFHGQRVTSPDRFVQLVQRTDPGMISLEVNRNERVRQLDVDFPEFAGQADRGMALRPEFDDPNVERLSERREDRIEDRREFRQEGGSYIAPPTYRPAPSTGPVRRALFPRLRGR